MAFNHKINSRNTKQRSNNLTMRQMMTPEMIQHNCDCFKKQMKRFIEFGEDKAMMLNNAEWLLKLNYVELLREVGACFSVNNMLRAECYKQRMEKGLSFLEFNYMIMCNTTDCQVYNGVNASGTDTDAAVDATAGECVRYQGALAETVYHSSDGGATESAENVWGKAVGYLIGKADPYEATISIPNYSYAVTYSPSELT